MGNSVKLHAESHGGAHAKQVNESTCGILPFNQAAFDSFILENKVIGFFEKPITLKSGRQSFWYVNWRTVSEDAFLLDTLSDFVISFLQGLIAKGHVKVAPDTLYGVPEGATKVALLAQLKWARLSGHFKPGSHVLAMGRGKPKEHGVPKDKYFLGVPRGHTVVIEDVTTTGGSLLTCVDSLRASEVDCSIALGLTNRMELRDDRKSVAQALESLSPSVAYFHMSNAVELLPQAARLQKPSAKVLAEVEKEFAEVGVAPIKF
jgi:orotate phosphoribosyltransferase